MSWIRMADTLHTCFTNCKTAVVAEPLLKYLCSTARVSLQIRPISLYQTIYMIYKAPTSMKNQGAYVTANDTAFVTMTSTSAEVVSTSLYAISVFPAFAVSFDTALSPDALASRCCSARSLANSAALPRQVDKACRHHIIPHLPLAYYSHHTSVCLAS